MRALDMASQLADQAARDPVAAVQNAEKIGALLRRARAEGSVASAAALGALTASGEAREARDTRLGAVLERLTELVGDAGRPLGALGASHIVRVDGVGPLTAAAPEGGPYKVEWPGGEGIVRSVFAGSLDGAPDVLSRVSVRIAINGSDELFTTGTAAAFVPLVVFQPQNHNWFRLRDFAVTAVQRWTVSFRYEGAQAGAPAVTPFLLFGFARRH